MKRTLLLMSFLLFGSIAYAQSLTPEVMSSSGDHSVGTNAQLSWTIGESMINTFTSTTNQLTQGFHQTNLTVTTVNDLSENFTVNIYPNPTADLLNIEWEADGLFDRIILIDENGTNKITQKLSPFSTNSIIDLGAQAAGSYFLHFNDKSGKTIKTFKVLKIK